MLVQHFRAYASYNYWYDFFIRPVIKTNQNGKQ